MLTITNRQGNANQTQAELSAKPVGVGVIKKTANNMLLRAWRKGNPPEKLVQPLWCGGCSKNLSSKTAVLGTFPKSPSEHYFKKIYAPLCS